MTAMRRAAVVAVVFLVTSLPAFGEFVEQSVEECLAETSKLFVMSVTTDECRARFKEITGDDPVEVYTLEDIVLVMPDMWMIPGAGAITVCQGGSAPRIAVNSFYIYSVGAVIGANVLVHELAHVAMCDRKLRGLREERLACEAAEACVPTGTDCRKQAQRY